jgi:uroporphyrinogen-III decarboxylase
VESKVKKWKRNYFAVAAMWTTLFEISWALRGFGRFIKDLYSDSRFADSLLDKLLEYRLETGKRFIDLGVDMIHLGDDFGTQKNLLLSLDVWRRHFKPRMKMLIEALKKRGDVYIMYHSDGNIEKLIPELIEIGVQILNPIQPECMDPAAIKERYGEKLTLHGTISIQRTLPFGTKEDVRTEAITRLKTCGPGGGLVLAPSHAPQPDVPVENIITLYKTAKNTPCSSLASLQ